MQARLFPADLREPLAEIREILENTEEYADCNFSYGIFDDTRMVGYVFAWVETESVVFERDEEVLYLKEIALSPGYEAYLRPLFERLYRQWRAYSPGIPLEAHVMPDALEKWNRLIRLFRFYGLNATVETRRSDPTAPPYRLLRLDVDPGTVDIADRPRQVPRARWQFDDELGVTVVSDPNQWLSLRDRWDELVSETPDGSVFHGFDYLWQWWKFHGTWRDLRVFVIRRNDEIIGVVPMMIDYYPVFGRSMRNLLFLTATMDMNRPKMIFGRHGELCLPAFLGWLKAHPAEWDILDIEEQLPGPLFDELEGELRREGHLIARSGTVCPYITFEDSWEAFLASRTSRMRSNVKRIRRRLAEEGAVRVDLATRPPEIDKAMAVFRDIESRSWKSGEHLDLESDRARLGFNQALARVFGKAGAFQIRTLVCDDRPIASTYGIASDGVFQSLKIAHDDAFQRFSPGTLLESYEIESLFDSGLQSYEFLGSFVANKLRWTDKAYNTINLHVFRRRPQLVLFFFLYFRLRTAVKGVLKRTGQSDRVFRIMNRFGIDLFPRYD